MQEENLSGSQSLALIQSMINKAKNQFGENGHLYLVWGWVILFCSLLQFVLLNYLKYPNHEMVWMLTWVAVIYQFIYLYRNRKKEKVKTYMGDILSYVWLVFVVLLILNLSLISILLKGDAYKLIKSNHFIPVWNANILVGESTSIYAPGNRGNILLDTRTGSSVYTPTISYAFNWHRCNYGMDNTGLFIKKTLSD